jgi:RNA polymerase sigma factor (sigma-70 family)
MPVPRSDREATRRLIARAQAGDRQAMEQLLEEHRPFVLSVARRYANRFHPLADVVQEGLLGLVKAIERFDTGSGYALTTYAFHWVRQSILRALPAEEMIRYPAYIWQSQERIRAARELLLERLGRPPSLLWLARETGMTPDHLRHVLGAARVALSLDQQVGADEEDTLEELLPGEAETAIVTDQLVIADEVDRLLRQLEVRDREIVVLYFGLDGQGERSLAEVGVIIGLTRERIRQRLKAALKTLAERVETEGS